MDCYQCCNFYRMGCFGGYNMCMCRIYGSLDIDQNERHPDTAALTCKMYNIPPKLEEQGARLPKWNKIPEPFVDF